MSTFGPARSEGALDRLSEKERRVALLLAEGHSDKGIAEAMGISEPAVKQIVHRLYARFWLDREPGRQNRVRLARIVWDEMRGGDSNRG